MFTQCHTSNHFLPTYINTYLKCRKNLQFCQDTFFDVYLSPHDVSTQNSGHGYLSAHHYFSFNIKYHSSKLFIPKKLKTDKVNKKVYKMVLYSYIFQPTVYISSITTGSQILCVRTEIMKLMPM